MPNGIFPGETEEVTVIDVTLNPINNYTPTQWQTGDIVSSEKLNKIENNVGPFIVKPTLMKLYVDAEGLTGGKIVINASYNDIKNAVMAGRQVLLVYDGEVIFGGETEAFCEMAYLAGIKNTDTYQALFTSSAEILRVIAELQDTACFSAPNGLPDEPLEIESEGLR